MQREKDISKCTRSNAAFLYDDNNNLAAEEEKYKPWTLR
jgi:hypothetical protein